MSAIGNVGRVSQDGMMAASVGDIDWRRYTHDRTLPDVLDAALDVFVEFGYHGTTVRAIATRPCPRDTA